MHKMGVIPFFNYMVSRRGLHPAFVGAGMQNTVSNTIVGAILKNLNGFGGVVYWPFQAGGGVRVRVRVVRPVALNGVCLHVPVGQRGNRRNISGAFLHTVHLGETKFSPYF